MSSTVLLFHSFSYLCVLQASSQLDSGVYRISLSISSTVSRLRNPTCPQPPSPLSLSQPPPTSPMSSTTLPSPTLRLHTLTTTLSDLRTQLAQALSLPPPPPPPLSNSLSASSVSLSDETDEIDRRAKEIVEEHIRLLHDLNETRDAAEVSECKNEGEQEERERRVSDGFGGLVSIGKPELDPEGEP